MSEEKLFEEIFEDHLLLRDSTLIMFLILGYGVSMQFLIIHDWFISIVSGVLFAAIWLTVMEIYARRKNSSMFRYFLGGDSLEEKE